jgi:hypothetical protein
MSIMDVSERLRLERQLRQAQKIRIGWPSAAGEVPARGGLVTLRRIATSPAHRGVAAQRAGMVAAVLLAACGRANFELHDRADGGGDIDAADLPDAAPPDATPAIDACSPVAESCDGVDNDCSRAIDDAPEPTALCPAGDVCVAGSCVTLPASWGCQTFQASTHAYAVCAQLVDQPTALARCQMVGGHLVTLTSGLEEAWLRPSVAAVGTSTWIGLRREAGCVNTWVTGEPVDYVNWAPGEPNGSCPLCAQLFLAQGFAWDDANCTATRAFACEWEP